MKNLLTLAGALTIALNTTGQTVIWNNQSHPADLATLSVGFSNDGTQVISGSECDSARVRIWNTATGAQTWEYIIGSGLFCANGVSLSANGTSLGIAEETGTLFVFDYTTPTPVLVHTINVGVGMYSIRFSPNSANVAVDGDDGSVRIYDVASGNLIRTISGNNGAVFSLDYNNDGTLLAAGSQDNNVRIWNANDGSLVATLTGHTSDIASVKFSADGSHLVTASTNGQIKVWMPMMGNMWMLHIGYSAPENLHQIDVSDDLEYVIAGGVSETFVYETFTGDLRANFNVTDGEDVYSVDFQPSTYNAVTGTGSGRVVYWGLNDLLAVGDLGKAALELEVFPNPTSDQVTLSMAGTTGPVEVKLYAADGRLVRAERLNELRSIIDLSELPAATYLLRAETEDRIGVRSITKR